MDEWESTAVWREIEGRRTALAGCGTGLGLKGTRWFPDMKRVSSLARISLIKPGNSPPVSSNRPFLSSPSTLAHTRSLVSGPPGISTAAPCSSARVNMTTQELSPDTGKSGRPHRLGNTPIWETMGI